MEQLYLRLCRYHVHELPCPKAALELFVLDMRPCCTSSVPSLHYLCWQASSCSLVSCQDLSCQTPHVPAQVATRNCGEIRAALAFAGHCNSTQHGWGHRTEIPTRLHLQCRALNHPKPLGSQITVFPQPVLVLPLSQQCPCHSENDFFHQAPSRV